MRGNKWIIIPFELQTDTDSYEGYLIQRNDGDNNPRKVILLCICK